MLLKDSRGHHFKIVYTISTYSNHTFVYCISNISTGKLFLMRKLVAAALRNTGGKFKNIRMRFCLMDLDERIEEILTNNYNKLFLFKVFDAKIQSYQFQTQIHHEDSAPDINKPIHYFKLCNQVHMAPNSYSHHLVKQFINLSTYKFQKFSLNSSFYCFLPVKTCSQAQCRQMQLQQSQPSLELIMTPIRQDISNTLTN